MLFAENIVHVVEVQLEQFYLAWRLVRCHVNDALQVKDLSEYAPLIDIGSCFFQALCLILIELCVEEELSCSARVF